jgi:predicted dehydrogenase
MVSNADNKKIKIGIIGTGRYGEKLIRAYKEMPEIEIYAVCDKNEKRAKNIVKKYDIPLFFKNYKKLLRLKDIKVVVIATPPLNHFRLVLNCIKKRKHVLCEKPIALYLKETKKLKKILNKRNNLLGINYILRENPIIQKVKEIIDKEILGNVQNVIIENFVSDSNFNEENWFWKKAVSGGIWISEGIDFFDILRYWLNQHPSEMFSSSIKRTKQIEDQVAGLCAYNKGTLVVFLNSITNLKKTASTDYVLNFDKGKIRIKGRNPKSIEIKALVNEKGYRELIKIMGKAKRNTRKIKEKVRARGRSYIVTRFMNLHLDLEKTNKEILRECIKKKMLNFIKAVQSKENLRAGFEQGAESLKDADMAERNRFYSFPKNFKLP